MGPLGAGGHRLQLFQCGAGGRPFAVQRRHGLRIAVQATEPVQQGAVGGGIEQAPVILLAKIGQADLLLRLPERTVIPESAAAEIKFAPPDDPGRCWLENLPPGIVQTDKPLPIETASAPTKAKPTKGKAATTTTAAKPLDPDQVIQQAMAAEQAKGAQR